MDDDDDKPAWTPLEPQCDLDTEPYGPLNPWPMQFPPDVLSPEMMEQYR